VIPTLFGDGKADVAGFAATLPYQAEPETRWNYNSGGIDLLSRLVSETVGGGEAGMPEFMKHELTRDDCGYLLQDEREGVGQRI